MGVLMGALLGSRLDNVKPLWNRQTVHYVFRLNHRRVSPHPQDKLTPNEAKMFNSTAGTTETCSPLHICVTQDPISSPPGNPPTMHTRFTQGSNRYEYA